MPRNLVERVGSQGYVPSGESEAASPEARLRGMLPGWLVDLILQARQQPMPPAPAPVPRPGVPGVNGAMPPRPRGGMLPIQSLPPRG